MDNLIKNIADLIPITCDNDGKVTGNQFFDGIKSIFKDNIYVRNTPEMWVGKLYSYLREEEFWRIVKEIGWPNKTPDLTPHNIKFLLLWKKDLCSNSLITVDEFKNLGISFCCILSSKMNQNDINKTGLGDASYSDLLYHIVGLGKEVYNESLNNPELIIQRGHKGDFVESFFNILIG